MPLFYVAPNIPTDVQEMSQLLPDPLANGLQKQLQATITIPVDPIVSHVPGIEYPGVPRDYGWHLPQIDVGTSNRAWQGIPLQAPDVQRSTAAFTSQIEAAGKFQETVGVTGVTVPLRAPGINEGY